MVPTPGLKNRGPATGQGEHTGVTGWEPPRSPPNEKRFLIQAGLAWVQKTWGGEPLGPWSAGRGGVWRTSNRDAVLARGNTSELGAERAGPSRAWP